METSTWGTWAGLAYKSATGDPPVLVGNECDSSPLDHFMGTAIIVLNTPFLYFYITGTFKGLGVYHVE